MNKLWLISLILCLLFLPAFGFADDEVVDFDSMEEDKAVDFDNEDSAPASPAGRFIDNIKLNLYIDLGMSAAFYPKRTDDIAEFSFDQDHHHFLVRAQYKDFITVQMELLNTFNQVTVQLKPDHFIFLGKILVPFGNIDYHPLYGGRVDEDSVFLPTTWSNLGIGYRSLIFNRRGDFSVYMLNGFGPSGGYANMTTMANDDFNILKAFGLRYKQQISSGFSLTGSALVDFPSGDDSWEDYLLLLGLDTVIKIKKFTFSAGYTVHGIYLESLGEQAGLPVPFSYLRSGSYVEGKLDLSGSTALRLRFGHIDPNSDLIDHEDRINTNLALILKFDAIEITTEYNLMMHAHPDASYEADNYQNSLKINALFQL